MAEPIGNLIRFLGEIVRRRAPPNPNQGAAQDPNDVNVVEGTNQGPSALLPEQRPTHGVIENDQTQPERTCRRKKTESVSERS